MSRRTVSIDAAIDRDLPHPGASGVGLGGQADRVERRGDRAGGARVRLLLGGLAARRLASSRARAASASSPSVAAIVSSASSTAPRSKPSSGTAKRAPSSSSPSDVHTSPGSRLRCSRAASSPASWVSSIGAQPESVVPSSIVAMNSWPPASSTTQPRRCSEASAPSLLEQRAEPVVGRPPARSASERQEARRSAWLWLFFRKRGIGQLTKRVDGPEHLLPAVDRLAADVHHPLDGVLGGVADRLKTSSLAKLTTSSPRS